MLTGLSSESKPTAMIARAIDFLGRVAVSRIQKQNRAVARHAQRDAIHPGEDHVELTATEVVPVLVHKSKARVRVGHILDPAWERHADNRGRILRNSSGENQALLGAEKSEQGV